MSSMVSGKHHPAYAGKSASELGKPFGLRGAKVSKFISKVLEQKGYTGRLPNVIARQRVDELKSRGMTTEAAWKTLEVSGIAMVSVPEAGGVAVLIDTGQKVWANYWGAEMSNAVTALIQQWVAEQSTSQASESPVEEEPSIEELELELGHTVQAAQKDEAEVGNLTAKLQRLLTDLATLQGEISKHTSARDEATQSAQKLRNQAEELRAAIEDLKSEGEEPEKAKPTAPVLKPHEEWILNAFKSHPDADIHYHDIYKAMCAQGIQIPRKKRAEGPEGAKAKVVNDVINKKLRDLYPNLVKVGGGKFRWNSVAFISNVIGPVAFVPPPPPVQAQTALPLEDPERGVTITKEEIQAILKLFVPSLTSGGHMLFKRIEGGTAWNGLYIDDIFWGEIRKLGKESNENNTELRESLDDLCRINHLNCFSRNLGIANINGESAEHMYAGVGYTPVGGGWKKAVISPRPVRVPIKRPMLVR